MVSLSSSTPVAGETDVFINKGITLTFDASIASASVTQGTINVIDITSGTSVDLDISVRSTDATKVDILPKVHLKENTTYRVTIVGEDSGLGVQVEDTSGNKLATTVFVEFATGDSVYQVDTTVEKDAKDQTLEGELVLPTNIKALGFDFVVDKVRPKNNSWNLGSTFTGVTFTFNKGLQTGTPIEDWVTVNAYPILSDESYLASGTDMGAGNVIPGHYVAVTGTGEGAWNTDIAVTFSGQIPKNTAIFIELQNGISAVDGTEYGGNLEYSVVTELYPKISGVDFIKNEIRPLAEAYKADYIAALLFKNTIWLWEKVGQSIPISSFPHAAKQYVVYTTVLDLIEDVDLSKFLKAGVRRRLGDMEISVENLFGRVAMKVAKYEKLKEMALQTLYRGYQFQVGLDSTAYEDAVLTVSRLWYGPNNRYTHNTYKFWQESIPASNVRVNRAAKTNNPWF